MSLEGEVGVPLVSPLEANEDAQCRGCSCVPVVRSLPCVAEVNLEGRAFDDLYEEENEDRARGTGRFVFSNGAVVDEIMPSFKHDSCAAEFIVRAGLWGATQFPDLNDVDVVTCAGYGPLNGQWFHEGDAAILPAEKPNGHPEKHSLAWPNVVLEVVYRTSLRQARQKACRWLGADTDVQLVVLIKIPDEQKNKVCYFVELYNRGEAEAEVNHFTGVNQRGQMFLTIRKEALLFGMPQLLYLVGDVGAPVVLGQMVLLSCATG